MCQFNKPVPFTHVSDMLLKPTGARSQYDVIKCSVLDAVCDEHVQHECNHSSNKQTTSTAASRKYDVSSISSIITTQSQHTKTTTFSSLFPNQDGSPKMSKIFG